jgi:biotin carboxyl carrier protein
MILEISNSDDNVLVKIVSDGGKKHIRMGEKEVICDWVKLAYGHYSLILDGNVLDVLVNIDHESCVVTSRAGTFSFGVVDPRRSESTQRTEEGPVGVERLCAEMPGKIVRVLVQEGDTVAFDQSLVVLEAMKMQNEIRAPKNGVVKEVAAVAGNAVSTGDFLLSVES